MKITSIVFVFAILTLGTVNSHNRASVKASKVSKQVQMLRHNLKHVHEMDAEQQEAFILFVRYLAVMHKIFTRKYETKEEKIIDVLSVHDSLLNAFDQASSKKGHKTTDLLAKFIRSLWGHKNI